MHLYLDSLYIFFFHFLSNGRIFLKKIQACFYPMEVVFLFQSLTLFRAILSKTQENFCKGLNFGIRTRVCSYIQLQRLQKPYFVIGISNLSIPFLISFIQSNNLFSKNNLQDRIWYSQSRGRIPQQLNSI